MFPIAAFIAFLAVAPGHQQDGFRDIGGCDASTRVAIKNDAGDIIYWNMQCPGKVAGNRTADIAEAKAREEAKAH